MAKLLPCIITEYGGVSLDVVRDKLKGLGPTPGQQECTRNNHLNRRASFELVQTYAFASDEMRKRMVLRLRHLRLDLRNANLDGMDLTGIPLVYALMWGAQIHNTILTGADLTEADLRLATWTLPVCYRAVLDCALLDGAELNVVLNECTVHVEHPFDNNTTLNNLRWVNCQMRSTSTKLYLQNAGAHIERTENKVSRIA